MKANYNVDAEIGGDFFPVVSHEVSPPFMKELLGLKGGIPQRMICGAQKNSPATTDLQVLEGDRLPVTKMFPGWKERIKGDATTHQPTSTREEEELEEELLEEEQPEEEESEE